MGTGRSAIVGVTKGSLSVVGHGGCEAPPNTRVEQTQSSPSALREPLTRQPLGGRHERSTP